MSLSLNIATSDRKKFNYLWNSCKMVLKYAFNQMKIVLLGTHLNAHVSLAIHIIRTHKNEEKLLLERNVLMSDCFQTQGRKMKSALLIPRA